MPDVVRAAGGIVWRRVGTSRESGDADAAGGEGAGKDGESGKGMGPGKGGEAGKVRRRDLEVVLVHRPGYDDWSFPKGKCDPGESDEDAALREVEEETGLRCRLGPELVTVEYVNGGGRTKRVRYWAMTVRSATPRSPDDEVDATRWLPLGEAQVLLSYERDRNVARSLPKVLNGV